MKQGYQKSFPISEITVEDRFREDLGDIEELANSILNKGLLQPITISTEGRLLAGGRRLKAAKTIGMKEIPVIVRKTEDRIDELEIELFENVHRKDMHWSEEAALTRKIHDLMLEKDPKWSEKKTAEMLGVTQGRVNQRLAVVESIKIVPELKNMKTEKDAKKAFSNLTKKATAEVLSERHIKEAPKGKKEWMYRADANFAVGDTFEFMQTLSDNGVIHLIECDPPYGIDLHSQKRGDTTTDDYHEIDEDEYLPWLMSLSKELFRVAGRNCFLIFWYGSSHYCSVITALESAGWIVDSIPNIWFKGRGQTNAPHVTLGRSYENFLLARKGSPKLNVQGKSNVFIQSPLPTSEKIHPTEKPFDLMYELVSMCLFAKQVCFVPFLGSGVTLRACYKNKNLAYGCDLSEDHKNKFILKVNQDVVNGVYNDESDKAGESA